MRRWIRLLFGAPFTGQLRSSPLYPGQFHPGRPQAAQFPFVFGLWVASVTTFVHPLIASAAYTQETPADAQRTVWDGVYNEAQAERAWSRLLVLLESALA